MEKQCTAELQGWLDCWNNTGTDSKTLREDCGNLMYKALSKECELVMPNSCLKSTREDMVACIDGLVAHVQVAPDAGSHLGTTFFRNIVAGNLVVGAYLGGNILRLMFTLLDFYLEIDPVSDFVKGLAQDGICYASMLLLLHLSFDDGCLAFDYLTNIANLLAFWKFAGIALFVIFGVMPLYMCCNGGCDPLCGRLKESRKS